MRKKIWYFGMHFTEKASLRTSYFLISNVKCGNVSWIHWNSMSLRRLFFYMFIISNILYLEEYFFTSKNYIVWFHLASQSFYIYWNCRVILLKFVHIPMNIRVWDIYPADILSLNDSCSIASEENSTIFFCH